jgi:glycosyltransferase involved in cell wall biosynthesis
MIGTIVRVARGEGLRSVATRTAERVSESVQSRLRFARGAFARMPSPSLVNVLTTPPSPRLGGVVVQLNARLAEERRLREVALFHSGELHASSRAWRTTLSARTLVIDGAFGDLPPLPDDAEVILVIHDFSLIENEALLRRARALIFPSRFLRDAYGRADAHVIEPGIAEVAVQTSPIRTRVAVVGSVKPHKGGALIPELIRATPGAEWHIFGGGDVELLRAIRGQVHGYYRAGSLPQLLAKHRIGLAVLPSIVPESFSLTLSECWSAGVPVVAFDHGAIAERIRTHGGGFLIEHDVEAMAAAVRDWLRGANVDVPARVPTALAAAAAHVALYRELGVAF